MEEIKIVIREYEPANDESYIRSSWSNASYFSALIKKKEEAPIYVERKYNEIKDILSYADIKVACLEDSRSTIIGYCVTTGTHLNWIHVKVSYRLQGIAKLLFPKGIESVTDDVTKSGNRIVQKKKLKKENDNGRNSEDRQTDQIL